MQCGASPVGARNKLVLLLHDGVELGVGVELGPDGNHEVEMHIMQRANHTRRVGIRGRIPLRSPAWPLKKKRGGGIFYDRKLNK